MGYITIIFEYYLHDEYGNEIYYELKHKATYVSKDVYDQLCEQYDEEYAYLRSEEFYAEMDSPEYYYQSYFDGRYDLNGAGNADFNGVITRYYRVMVKRILKVYTVTEVRNDGSKDSVMKFRYNQLFTCPSTEYYKVVEAYRVKHDHYFVGYDVDGDGIVDYRPGEKILITKDMRLYCIWKCAWEDPCGQD